MSKSTKIALTASLLQEAGASVADRETVAEALRSIHAKKRVTKAEIDAAVAMLEEAAKPASRSIVPKTYKQVYKLHGGSCGDEISRRMKDFVTVENSLGDMVCSEDRLRELASLNGGLWNPKWDRLNIGQMRMNLGNRLRNLAKKGREIEIPEA